MAITRVNSATISAASTSATAYSTTLGVAANAGDVIYVVADSQGTHATNGMSCKDSVNNVNFTTVLETNLGNASTRWVQTFVYKTPQALASGTTISVTPYAAATITNFVADIFRGADSVIDKAAVGASNGTGTTSVAAPALASNATAGALVLTCCSIGAGTVTPGTPFTAGSVNTAGPSTAIGYVLGASGSSTYGSTWTLGTAGNNATQTVSFAAAAAGGTLWAPQIATGPPAALLRADYY